MDGSTTLSGTLGVAGATTFGGDVFLGVHSVNLGSGNQVAIFYSSEDSLFALTAAEGSGGSIGLFPDAEGHVLAKIQGDGNFLILNEQDSAVYQIFESGKIINNVTQEGQFANLLITDNQNTSGNQSGLLIIGSDDSTNSLHDGFLTIHNNIMVGESVGIEIRGEGDYSTGIKFTPSGSMTTALDVSYENIATAIELGQNNIGFGDYGTLGYSADSGGVMFNGSNNPFAVLSTLTGTGGGAAQFIVLDNNRTNGHQSVLILTDTDTSTRGIEDGFLTINLQNTQSGNQGILLTGNPGASYDKGIAFDLGGASFVTAIDLSSGDIGTAINLGSNDITFGGEGTLMYNQSSEQVELSALLGNNLLLSSESQIILDTDGGQIFLGNGGGDAIIVNDDSVLAFTGSQVDHGMTDSLPTDIYGFFGLNNDTAGGMRLLGLSENANTALNLSGYVGGSDPGSSAIEFVGGVKSGTSVTTVGDSANLFTFSNFGTPLLSILGSGNFGLGTTSPEEKLDLRDGTFILTGSEVSHSFPFMSSDNAYGALAILDEEMGGLRLVGVSDSTETGLYFVGVQTVPSTTTPAIIFSANDATGVGITGDDLAFLFRTEGEHVSILGNGNVGLGMIDPSTRLEVSGGAISVSSPDLSHDLDIPGLIGNHTAAVLLVDDEDEGGATLIGISENGVEETGLSMTGVIGAGSTNKAAIMLTGSQLDGSGGIEAITGDDKVLEIGTEGPGFLTVHGNGNVAIGVEEVFGSSIPGYRLDVAANDASNYVARLANDGSNANRLGLLIQAGEYGASGAANTLIDFADGDGDIVGSITFDNTQTYYNTSSDQRLKKDIVSTVNGLDKVLQIPVRDYRFKRDPSGTLVTGFIAQELNQIFPQAVTTGSENNPYWSVDYGKLTPLLVRAIQEQQTSISTIQDKLNEPTQKAVVAPAPAPVFPSTIATATTFQKNVFVQGKLTVSDIVFPDGSTFAVQKSGLVINGTTVDVALFSKNVTDIQKSFGVLETKFQALEARVAALEEKATSTSGTTALSEVDVAPQQNNLSFTVDIVAGKENGFVALVPKEFFVTGSAVTGVSVALEAVAKDGLNVRVSSGAQSETVKIAAAKDSGVVAQKNMAITDDMRIVYTAGDDFAAGQATVVVTYTTK